MALVEVKKVAAVMFVEVNGKTCRVTLPNERMELLLPLAASLFDDGKLGLAETDLFSFAAARVAAGVAAGDETQRAAELVATVGRHAVLQWTDAGHRLKVGDKLYAMPSAEPDPRGVSGTSSQTKDDHTLMDPKKP